MCSISALIFLNRLPEFNRVEITLEWIEPNSRRDPDNVMAGKKFILDGMVEAGMIKNDTWEFIKLITHKFGESNKHKPSVTVTVKEAE